MTDEIKKVVRDGKVAVLVSPGFGAGWSTWNTQLGPAAVFDPDMVADVLAKKDPTETAVRKYPEAYHGGCSQLIVEWVDQGDRFEIDDCDGSESLRVFGPDDGIVA